MKKDNIKKHAWKYMEGYHIGDWIQFDNNGIFDLTHDTIFKVNVPVAKIQNSTHGFLGTSGKLIIKSLVTNEIGTYTEK